MESRGDPAAVGLFGAFAAATLRAAAATVAGSMSPMTSPVLNGGFAGGFRGDLRSFDGDEASCSCNLRNSSKPMGVAAGACATDEPGGSAADHAPGDAGARRALGAFAFDAPKGDDDEDAPLRSVWRCSTAFVTIFWTISAGRRGFLLAAFGTPDAGPARRLASAFADAAVGRAL